MNIKKIFLFLTIGSTLLFQSDSATASAEFSLTPGSYNANQKLSIQNITPGTLIFYSFVDNFEETAPLLKFNKALELSAVPGEVRQYNIIVYFFLNRRKVDEKQLTYYIDRRGPGAPGMSPAAGEYSEDQTVLFSKKDIQAVYYSVNQDINENAAFWDGGSINLTAEKGGVKMYTITAYSVDEVGNKSKVEKFNYIINKTDTAAGAPAVTINSPVTGTFTGKQLLVLEGTNVSRIKYTTDGTDPMKKGSYYAGPILIGNTGSVTVKTAAVSRKAGGEVITGEVKYTVTPDTSSEIIVNKGSGTYTEDITINLSLPGNIQFFYTTDGTTPHLNSTSTTGDITLNGEEGQITTIDLRFKALLEDALLTGEYRNVYIIDKRDQTEPEVFLPGEDNTGPFTTSVTVQLKGSGEGEIYYTLDGFPPHNGSEKLHTTGGSGSINVSPTQAGDDGYVLLKAVVIDSKGNSSRVTVFPILFDVNAPGNEVTREEKALQTVGNNILISLQADSTYVYEIASGTTVPPDPGISSTGVSGSIYITVPPGMEKKFTIKVGKVQGPRVVSIQTYNYILDRKPPPNPTLKDFPGSGISNIPVSFSFEETTGKIYYQVTDDGSTPVIMANQSPRFLFPVKLSGKQDLDVTYKITAMAVDERNNLSPLLFEETFRIDRMKPPIPDQPVVAAYGAEVEQKYSVYWDDPAGYSIYYLLRDNLHIGDSFSLYSEPVTIDFSQIEDGVIIESFRQDKAGNRSRLVTFRINPGSRDSSPPIITGAGDGGLYNERVVLRFLTTGGEVHYEMTNDGTEPLPVKYDSPAAGKMLILDVEEGMKVNYRLKVRSYDPEIRDITNPENQISFTIDKEHPPAPVLLGIKDGDFYYEQTMVGFRESEDVIFYAITGKNGEHGSNVPAPSEFKRYSSPVGVDVYKGESRRYRVLSFSVDAAGNISKKIPSWDFTIDKSAVYLSESGNDLYEGTRERPFKNLERAIDYSLKTGRKKIFAAAGSYFIEKTIKIANDVELAGGYNADSWEPEEGQLKSLVFTRGPFRRGKPLLDILHGEVKISGVLFSDPLNGCPELIEQSGGKLILEDMVFIGNSLADSNCLHLSDAELTVINSFFTSSSTTRGTFITAGGGRVIIDNTELTGPGEAESFICIKISDNSFSRIDRGRINPGTGTTTTGILAIDSRIELFRSKLSSGKGKANGVAINLRKSTLGLDKSIINCRAESKYAAGILGNSVDITVKESIINVDGDKGATGIKLSGGELNMHRSRLTGNRTSEFLYLVNVYRSRGFFFNNVIRGADSEDAICVVIDESITEWFNNSIIAGRGANLTSAFMIKGNYQSNIINNIIVREGFLEGAAFHLIGAREIDFLIMNNNFTGWKNLMEIDYISKGGANLFYSPAMRQYVEGIEDLNGFDGDVLGANIHGNVTENYFKTFRISKFQEFHLSPFSACVNGGLNVSNFKYEELSFDIDGDRRPAEKVGIRPAYDIGADEYPGEE